MALMLLHNHCRNAKAMLTGPRRHNTDTIIEQIIR